MTNKEKLLLVKFIDIAAQEFSNHGCNDVPDKFWSDFTPEEKSALVYDMHLQNGDPEEFDPKYLDVSDW